MQAAGGGTEFKDGAPGVFGVRRGTIPNASAAVNAFLAVKDREAIRTGCDRLAATDFDANLRAAAFTKVRIKEHDMVGVTGRGLYLAAHQQRVLMRDEQFAVVGNRRLAPTGSSR